MKNNKGFTLIELIGIVIILVLIFLVAFPNFLTIARSSEDKGYEVMIKNLCLAGETYINLNKEKFSSFFDGTDASLELYISVLMDLDYIDSNIIDPNKDKSIRNSKLYYVIESGKLDCNYNFIE